MGNCYIIHASYNYVTAIMLAIFCIMLASVDLLEWLPALSLVVVRNYLCSYVIM